MKPSPRRNVHLLKYQSKSSSGFGVEVVFDAQADLRLLLDDLQWLTDVAEAEAAPDFFVMEVLASHGSADLRALAEDAAAHGLAGKLCLVVSSRLRPPDDLLVELLNLGIRVLLGGVGPDARFSDLTDSLVDGIVLDRTLISNASGDPQAASVLEAIVALATNLGLRTFAHRCSQQVDFDVALSCGVDYLTLDAEPPRESPATEPLGFGQPRTGENRASHH